MKTALIAASALLGALGLAGAAVAQDAHSITGWYAGVGANSHDTDSVGHVATVDGRLGYQFNNWLSAEGEAGFGVNKKSIDSLGDKAKINNREGLYGRATYPVGNLNLFARAGWARTDYSISGPSAGTYRDNADGFSYGAGAEYFFDGHNGVRGDYTRDDFNHDAHANVWGASFVHRF